jgi:cell division septation protein DedD
MKKNGFIAAIYLVCSFLSFAFAAPDSLYSQAQKLFSKGNFDEAAKIYANVCSTLEAKEKKFCQLNEVKALIESQKINQARAAEPKLLSLISLTEPSDSLFAELSAQDSKLQIMLDQPIRAIRSWNAAQASANIDYFPEIFALCQDIVSAYPSNGLTAETCNKIKPSDTALISLPRKKTVPLSKTSVTATHFPATSASTANKWYIQLGAFGSKANAEKLVADFKSKGVQLYITELADRKLFTVRAGSFATKAEAESFAEQKIAPAHPDYKVLQ